MFNLLLNKYTFVFAIVPLVAILLYGMFIDIYPKESAIHEFLNKTLHLIAETDLHELMLKNNLKKTSTFAFQILRIFIGLIGVFAGYVFVSDEPFKKVVICLVLGAVFYKAVYFFLKYKEAQRIKSMNKTLPYAMKTIAYLAYVYPVTNAIERSINLVPPEFKYDLEILFKEIQEDPITKKPYENFVNRYDGRLKDLDINLTLLYRMTQSGGEKSKTLLSNLNETVSEEINRVRAEKNKAFNQSVGWLGMVPVALLVVILVYLLVLMTTSVTFI